MVTNFGKFCRKLRIDNNELLFDMAQKLQVSSTFLSKVENGKKKPPEEWKNKLINLYNIDDYYLDELNKSFFEALNYDSIDIRNLNEQNKELMLSFARKLDLLDTDQLRKINNILNNK